MKVKEVRIRKGNQTMSDPDFDLLEERQAARLVKVLPHTLMVWRCRTPHKAPPHLKLGRKVYYRRTDLRDWLAAQVVRAREGAA